MVCVDDDEINKMPILLRRTIAYAVRHLATTFPDAHTIDVSNRRGRQ